MSWNDPCSKCGERRCECECSKIKTNIDLECQDYGIHPEVWKETQLIAEHHDKLIENCNHDYSDGTGTGWYVCKKCGDMY